MDLFKEQSEVQRLALSEAQVSYYPQFINPQEANSLFKELLDQTPWRQDPITVFGKEYMQPRLTALYAVNQNPYTYSGITMNPLTFTSTLLALKEKLDPIAQTAFTTVLLNLYRDGSDSNGWHSDDEPELGKNPIIASLSLGQTRAFRFRKKNNRKETHKIMLEHGSLLLMRGATQHTWQHQIPKTSRVVGPRINLTFRVIN